MQAVSQTAQTSKSILWTGRIIMLLTALFMLSDAVMKILVLAPVVEAQTQLQVPLSLTAGIGIVELLCVALYLLPRTSVLGAVLLTGYLGGATAIQLRIATPFYFPVITGVLVWVGLVLTDDRLRSLLPLRRY